MAEMFHTIELIPIGKIRPNDYNPNAMPPAVFSELVGNIKRRGFKSAIYVRPADPDGVHVIVDGEQRWKAAQEAGHTELPCVVLPATEDEAMMDTITMNQLKGNFVPAKLARIAAELAKRYGLAQLEQELGFEPNELKDQMELEKLPDELGPALEMQARMEEENALHVLTFVVHRPQAEVIEAAIAQIERHLEGRNLRGRALEHLAAEYLAGARQPDAAAS